MKSLPDQRGGLMRPSVSRLIAYVSARVPLAGTVTAVATWLIVHR
ncbi:hypothetical protein ACFLIM_44820 [Nonomuraea sp. M3C6]|uniref:Uncharacterized protein n=1 Tax=Nonomuraea marmarensis TaxID=3351344 RepID=A0ABW7ASB4_9ACTN